MSRGWSHQHIGLGLRLEGLEGCADVTVERLVLVELRIRGDVAGRVAGFEDDDIVAETEISGGRRAGLDEHGTARGRGRPSIRDRPYYPP